MNEKAKSLFFYISLLVTFWSKSKIDVYVYSYLLDKKETLIESQIDLKKWGLH